VGEEVREGRPLTDERIPARAKLLLSIDHADLLPGALLPTAAKPKLGRRVVLQIDRSARHECLERE